MRGITPGGECSAEEPWKIVSRAAVWSRRSERRRKEPPHDGKNALLAAAICLGVPVPKSFLISSVKLNAVIPQRYRLAMLSRPRWYVRLSPPHSGGAIGQGAIGQAI